MKSRSTIYIFSNLQLRCVRFFSEKKKKNLIYETRTRAYWPFMYARIFAPYYTRKSARYVDSRFDYWPSLRVKDRTPILLPLKKNTC